MCAVGESQSASPLLASLMEQAGLKQSELDSHPVRSAMKQLLRSLDQLCPFEMDSATGRPDYMRSFLDYINMLASVLVRSLGSEGNIFDAELFFYPLIFRNVLVKRKRVCLRVCVCSDQSTAVKLGNPLLVLLQAPHQLLSHLLFDRQVTPDR